jgi:hypothetical protein
MKRILSITLLLLITAIGVSAQTGLQINRIFGGKYGNDPSVTETMMSGEQRFLRANRLSNFATFKGDAKTYASIIQPLVLAECKAPEIRIGERTLAQAVRYNSVLGARFVILTNGLRHYCCEYRDGKYVQLSGFPDFSAL